MVGSDGVRAVAAASLALSAWTGTFSLVHVVAVGCVLGAGWAIRPLAEEAAVLNVVAPQDIPRAIAIIQGRSYATGVAGPPLASALYALSAAIPFAAHAVSFTAAGTAAMLVRRPLQRTGPAEALRTGDLAGSSVREGFAYFWGTRFIRVTAALAAINEFVVDACGLILVVHLSGTGTAPRFLVWSSRSRTEPEWQALSRSRNCAASHRHTRYLCSARSRGWWPFCHTPPHHSNLLASDTSCGDHGSCPDRAVSSSGAEAHMYAGPYKRPRRRRDQPRHFGPRHRGSGRSRFACGPPTRACKNRVVHYLVLAMIAAIRSGAGIRAAERGNASKHESSTRQVAANVGGAVRGRAAVVT